MAELMDLSDEVLAELAKELMWPPGRGGDIARAFLAIRDAATVAERQRCIAIVESRLKDDGWTAHYKNAWVMILAALRGGDHE